MCYDSQYESAECPAREKEAVRVFIDCDTGRILGMAPASIKAPAQTLGLRWKAEVLNHAWEIERYLDRWREQAKFEAVLRTERQVARESTFRAAIASQIRARNQTLDPYNRDVNNAALAAMDDAYARKVKIESNPVVHGVAEAYEATTTSHEVSLDSAYFKHGAERVAQGERIEGDR